MRRVAITTCATLSALGEGTESLWQGLMQGRSGIAELERFDCSNYISTCGACIHGVELARTPEQSSGLDAILARLAPQLPSLPSDTCLLLASTKGEIDCLSAARRNAARPVPSVLFEPLLEKVRTRFGLADAGWNINAACASSTLALARGAALIAHGKTDVVLVYAADLLSEFVFSGFSALQALSPYPCRPFDQQRQGLTLGEAGAAVVLMSEERARREDLKIGGYINGWGAANDAHHVTAPARDGNGLIRACTCALNQAHVEASQISAINAHGTGTIYNDAMELTAFEALFGEHMPPVHGIKGSVGHCLGAAGALEVAVGCRTLQEQKLPPTRGCGMPEAGAQGRVKEQAQDVSGDFLLCCNSG
ncbi:MAG: beta-ketoacyl-[acyl-carrier-protein] synthase family protein, partial [Geobacteraceae bacterium]|nr:beta-ketoacyl-[acyl-carrier-protein] synthase family protein [Geobacteraceae bacterium]